MSTHLRSGSQTALNVTSDASNRLETQQKPSGETHSHASGCHSNHAKPMVLRLPNSKCKEKPMCFPGPEPYPEPRPELPTIPLSGRLSANLARKHSSSISADLRAIATTRPHQGVDSFIHMPSEACEALRLPLGAPAPGPAVWRRRSWPRHCRTSVDPSAARRDGWPAEPGRLCEPEGLAKEVLGGALP